MIDFYSFRVWLPGAEEPTEFSQRDIPRAAALVQKFLADYAAGKCSMSGEQDGPSVHYTVIYDDDAIPSI